MEAFRHCRPVFSIDGTFLLGKYMGTLLIAIACDANNTLVSLAFALVERDNKDNWGWFLRLVRRHVVGPSREVCVISEHEAMFNSKHEAAVKLQNKGDLLPSKPNEHLNDAKGFAHTHEVRLFDLSTGKYEVTERRCTTSDEEVRPPRKYVVLLSNFSCTCGRPRQYHFPCSHYIAAARHRNFSYMRSIPPQSSL